MGVYIKGMDEIPEDGAVLIVMHDANGKAYIKYACTYGYSMELVNVPEPHGDLIDRKVLSNSVLKWLPPDPCGDEYRERPFETDICVSMMMEIEEQDAVIEAEGER